MRASSSAFPSGSSFSRSFVCCLLAGGLIFPPASIRLLAGPTGEMVVAGQATFERAGPITTITAGHNSIINYSGFNIGASESVVFIQPSADSRVLNRVTSGDPTQIFGSLSANGMVYLVNPAGVFFGPNSFLDVGGLYAAAGNISNQDFLANTNRFSGLSGMVHNQGSLQSRSTLALVGNSIANHGSIVAPAGHVAMLSGAEVLVGEPGQSVFVNLGTADRAGVGIENTGTISTGGEQGSVTLAAGDLYSLAIRQSGTVRSPSVTLDGGSARTENPGVLDASSANGRGGSIQVLGREIVVAPAATIDASGATAGGTILVGGDFQGANAAVRNAGTTAIESGARLNADARDSGNGGRVIVWADQSTVFEGSISARGGARAGNGGFVEVSGKDFLAYRGAVDLRAPFGRNGQLLLDPANLTIGDVQDRIGDGSGFGLAGDIKAGDGLPGASSFVTAAQVAAILNHADLSLAASVNVTVKNAIDWNSEFGLTLTGGVSLAVDAPITNTGTGGITLSALSGLASIRQAVSSAGAVSIVSGGAMTLGADLRGSTVTLTNGGALSHSAGTIKADSLSLLGGGSVGTANAPLVTEAGELNLNKAGEVFVTEINDLRLKGTTSSGLTVNVAGVLTLGDLTATGVRVGANANSGITVDGSVSAAGISLNADSNNDGLGTFSVASTGVVKSGGLGLGITAADVKIEDQGVLDSGANGSITINASANRSIGLGDAAGDLSISRAELGALWAPGGLRIVGRGEVNVSGVSALDTQRNGAVTLETSGGNILFSGAASTFNGPLVTRVTAAGGETRLEQDVTSSGGSITLGGVGAGPVVVAAEKVSLEGSAGITLGATTGSNENELVLNGNSVGVTGSTIGRLGALRIGGAGTVSFSGAVTASSVVDLSAQAAGTVAFNGGLSAEALVTGMGAYSLIQNGGTIENPVDYEHAGSVSLTGVTLRNGATATEPASVVLSGTTQATTEGRGVTFSNVSLAADATVETNNGSVAFGAVDGLTAAGTFANLTVKSGSAAATFNGNVLNVGALTVDSAVLNTASISTAGSQTYTSNLTLGLDTVLTSTGGGAITFNGSVSGAKSLRVDTEGMTTFAGLVDGLQPLTSLDLRGPVTLAANRIVTVGAQTYAGPVTLTNPVTVTSRAGLPILFESTIDGAATLTVSTTGTSSLGGAVGGVTPLAGLTITGPIVLNAGHITTNGAQTYDAVTLGGSNVLTSDSGGAITFGRSVNGGADLEINTAGATTFSAPVGNTAPLASLVTDAAGRTVINGRAISTTGPQRYHDPLTLGADALLESGSDIDMKLGGSGPSAALNINATGTTSLSETFNLASLTTSPAGQTLFNGATIVTSGRQTYRNELRLQNAVKLTGGQVTFENRAASNPGGVASSLEVTADRVEVRDVLTHGNQIYNSANLTLGANHVTTGGNFTVTAGDGVMTSPGNLTIDAGRGAVSLGRDTVVPLGGLEITNAGSATLASTVASSFLRVGSDSITFTGDRYLAGTIRYTATNVSAQPSKSGTQVVVLGTASAAVDGSFSTTNSSVPLSRARLDSSRMNGLEIDFSKLNLGGDLRRVFSPDTLAAFSPSDISTFFASGVPSQAVDVTPQPTISQALRDQMVQLGIYARPSTDEERRAALLGAPIYQQIVETEFADPDQYEVADSRLSASAVRAALRTYNEIFHTPSRGDEIQQALAESFRTFAGGRTDAVDPVNFRGFLERSPEPAAQTARSAMKQLSRLFHQIDHLGLTAKEVDISKAVLLRPLRIPGLPPSTLRQAIEKTAAVAPAITPVPAAAATAESVSPARNVNEPRLGANETRVR